VDGRCIGQIARDGFIGVGCDDEVEAEDETARVFNSRTTARPMRLAEPVTRTCSDLGHVRGPLPLGLASPRLLFRVGNWLRK
jgi:hypothetical protein